MAQCLDHTKCGYAKSNPHTTVIPIRIYIYIYIYVYIYVYIYIYYILYLCVYIHIKLPTFNVLWKYVKKRYIIH